jgi:DNA-binding CsgD family transcriptional regulator/PAS domain-containing protein
MVGKSGGTIAYSAEQLSGLIGQIYDCVLNLDNWESVLAAVSEEFTFSSFMLGVYRPAHLQVVCQYAVGVEPEFLARFPEFAPDMAVVWGGPEQIQRYPLDEPIVNSWAVDRVVVSENRYFKEWTARGISDAVVIFMAKDDTLLGHIGFNRHESAGAIGKQEVDGLRLLAPHIRRAVTISNLFDMKTIEAATFGSALDSFSFGIILVDETLGIVHANRAAADILKFGNFIRSRKGRLSLPDTSANAALERGVGQAACDEAGLGPMGIGIPARGGLEPRVIHVMPLRKDTTRGRLGQRAAAALFIAPATSPSRMPIDALALIYDLTPAESRIIEMIAAGDTQAAIARTLGIAPSTVKTHVLHLFEKTGSTRQADLLKLAANLSAPV